jgi:hypothetical protein
LVTFNILISILMDGWTEAKERAEAPDEKRKHEQQINVWRSFVVYLNTFWLLSKFNHGLLERIEAKEVAAILIQEWWCTTHGKPTPNSLSDNARRDPNSYAGVPKRVDQTAEESAIRESPGPDTPGPEFTVHTIPTDAPQLAMNKSELL